MAAALIRISPVHLPLNAADIARALALAWHGTCAVDRGGRHRFDHEIWAPRAHATTVGVFIAGDRFSNRRRGRQQRVWRAAPLTGFVLVAFRAMRPSRCRNKLACGFALAECLAEHAVAVQAQWPNDVRVNGRKLRHPD